MCEIFRIHASDPKGGGSGSACQSITLPIDLQTMIHLSVYSSFEIKSCFVIRVIYSIERTVVYRDQRIGYTLD